MKYVVYAIEDGRKPQRLKSFSHRATAEEYSDSYWRNDDDADRMEIREEKT